MNNMKKKKTQVMYNYNEKKQKPTVLRKKD